MATMRPLAVRYLVATPKNAAATLQDTCSLPSVTSCFEPPLFENGGFKRTRSVFPTRDLSTELRSLDRSTKKLQRPSFQVGWQVRSLRMQFPSISVPVMVAPGHL